MDLVYSEWVDTYDNTLTEKGIRRIEEQAVEIREYRAFILENGDVVRIYRGLKRNKEASDELV